MKSRGKFDEPRFGFKGATIAQQSGHDRAAIGPRSCVDRDLDSQMTAVRFSWNDCDIDSVMNEPRLWLDCTTIVDFFHESFQLSDGDLTLHWSPRREENRASCGRQIMIARP